MGARLHKLRVMVWGEVPESPEEQKLLRKIDFSYPNRAGLGNAYVSGMREDLDLTGNQYNVLVTCLSVGYIIGQVPHGLVIQKIAPRIWFPLMTVVWALLTMACGAANSFTHLAPIRFFQGIAEASTYSGTQYIIGSWYKGPEVGKRVGLFQASGMVGTMSHDDSHVQHDEWRGWVGRLEMGIVLTLVTSVAIDATGVIAPYGYMACGVQIITCVVLLCWDLVGTGAKMGAYYLAGTAYAIQPIVFTWANWILSRDGDDAARAVILCAMNGASSVLFSVWGIALYPASDAARGFRKGTITMVIVAVLLAGCITVVGWQDKQTLMTLGQVVTPSWAYMASYNIGTPLLGNFHGADSLQVFFGIKDNYAARSIRAPLINFLWHLDPNGKGARRYPSWPQWDDGRKISSAKRRIKDLEEQLAQAQSELKRQSELIAQLRVTMSDPEATKVLRCLDPSKDVGTCLAMAEASNIYKRYRPSDNATTRALLPPIRFDFETELHSRHQKAYPILAPIDTNNIDLDSLFNSQEAIGIGKPGTTQLVEPPPPLLRGTSLRKHSPVEGPSPKPTYVDDRLQRLDIGYWTCVPISNEFAASVISLYLEIDHPVFGLFDSNLFLQDLVDHRLRFSSPFLVCALLCFACQTYTAVDIASAALTKAFLIETEGLWKAECSTDSLTTVAALSVFSLACATQGKPGLGMTLVEQARRMAQRMRLFESPYEETTLKALKATSPDFIKAASHTAWGMYNWLTYHALFYEDRPIAYPPLYPMPGLFSNTSDIPQDSGWPTQPLAPYTGGVFTSLYSSPEAVFHASIAQLKRILLLRLRQPAYKIYCSMYSLAILTVSSAVINEQADPASRFYFLLCARHCEELYIRYPVYKDILEGFLALAIGSSVISTTEAMTILNALRAYASHHEPKGETAGSFTIDFKSALEDRQTASAQALAQKFNDLTIFEQFVEEEQASAEDS
ncbi:pantothenate transporter liz1 [Paramyrothecium foliicola]|nr:pantothenate transporter liz1 [Paramyrothecium foliicola]